VIFTATAIAFTAAGTGASALWFLAVLRKWPGLDGPGREGLAGRRLDIATASRYRGRRHDDARPARRTANSGEEDPADDRR
jgi:hypothetical protein